MTKLGWIISWMLLLFSCKQSADKKDSETIKKGNKSISLSTDTSKLSTIINIVTYKPTHTKFNYILIDNSGQNERLTVPGPSDDYLQAVLYYDTMTLNKIKTLYFNADYPSPSYDRHDFNFDWLDANTRKELLESDSSYHGHPDYIFGLGTKGKLWMLDDKILLTKSTN